MSQPTQPNPKSEEEQMRALQAAPLPPQLEKIFSGVRAQFFAEMGLAYEKSMEPVTMTIKRMVISMEQMAKAHGAIPQSEAAKQGVPQPAPQAPNPPPPNRQARRAAERVAKKAGRPGGAGKVAKIAKERPPNPPQTPKS